MSKEFLLKPERMSGKFIVLDGEEGTGKSSQIQLLKNYLEQCGCRVKDVRDPGTTRIGEQIRAILLNPDHAEMAMKTETLLYMAARAQMMKDVILPAIADGQVVISDRFVSSTLAYQTCEEVTWEEIESVAKFVLSGPSGWQGPDYTVILDMPVEKAMERINRAKDRIEQRPIEYHHRVRENFLKVIDRVPGCIINADADSTVVHDRIVTVLAHRF